MTALTRQKARDAVLMPAKDARSPALFAGGFGSAEGAGLRRQAVTAEFPGNARPNYAGLRVTILGMGRQGIAAARFFLASGANVIVSDLRPAEYFAVLCEELTQYAAELAASSPHPSFRAVLGAHPLTLLDETDLLCLSGGVSPAIPIVQAAMERGIPLTNDAQLTLQYCPVPVIGITGSAGKTTTTTLVGLMLEAAGFVVHVGGNIGTPLLDRLDAVGSGEKVAMELSSFQAELLALSPNIASILNITPNHLDRHPSMSHYAAAKANVLRYQEPGDTCVLNADDDYTGLWLRNGRCRISAGTGQDAVYFPLLGSRLAFSLTSDVSAGAFLRGDQLIWRRLGLPDVQICRARDVRLRGRHNLANILAACCLAGTAGADSNAMTRVATTFGGVEHRLEVVRQRGDVLWVNDSIATAPERTAAAVRSFDEPVVLLLGGRDKHLPWDECVSAIYESRPGSTLSREGRGTAHVRHVILFGEAAGVINQALASWKPAQHERETKAEVPVTRCPDLVTAVAVAAQVAIAGDVVLLAPGGTSFDAYDDFAARGRHFRALVEALP